MLNYAVVLVTYNQQEKLLACLESLQHQNCPAKRIIVVDNGSTDDTGVAMLNLVQKYPEQIQYVRLATNRGCAGGFHKGLRLAQQQNFKWIALSTDDITYQSDFFNLLAQAVHKNPTVQCFSGSVYQSDGTVETSQRRKLLNHATLTQKDIAAKRYSNEFYLDLFTFRGILLKRELIQDIGLPNQAYFTQHTDTEYALRIRKQTKILNVSKAIVPHTDIAEPNDWKNYYFVRNQILVCKQYSSSKLFYLTVLLGSSLKKGLGILLKRKTDWLDKSTIWHLYWDSLRDGLLGKTGPNDRYSPTITSYQINLTNEQKFTHKKLV
ncbi:hypothetical protein BSQ39_02065 [Loigolactobacillus backii]|uniref:glycosyltransferase n=1 Tax=Loigolactobacillus backii TaxID=375175 RepID=UPI000C1CA4E9|nr:glycosyltransferase [Loigolactobacillus backii]PIO82431.1 hypothetical protein BSQ39_02065 [Loigolactobacillus backii]